MCVHVQLIAFDLSRHEDVLLEGDGGVTSMSSSVTPLCTDLSLLLFRACGAAPVHPHVSFRHGLCGEMSEATNESRKEDSPNDECDQDSSITFEVDTESTSSQEEEFEEWTELRKRSTEEADEKMLTYNITNWVETQKKPKWRQAHRIATQNQEIWTRKAAEWNSGLIISTRTQRRAGRPAKSWDDFER